jgi:hypothetical protein
VRLKILHHILTLQVAAVFYCMMKITGAQIRGGRALARLSINELAALARIGRMTVIRAELADDAPTTTEANLHAIRVALENKGVIFDDDGGINYRPRAANN